MNIIPSTTVLILQKQVTLKPLSPGKIFREVEMVMYEDKVLVCKECNNEFVFTAGEQEFYAEKGFVNEPQRCKACRDKRKAAAKAPREMHDAVCAQCGKECKVPFEPTEGRPVYCSECFAKLSEEQENEETE